MAKEGMVCPCCGKGMIPQARAEFLEQEGLPLRCVSCAQAAERKDPAAARKRAVMAPFKGADALETSEWHGFLRTAKQ